MNQFPRELWSPLPSERLGAAKNLDMKIGAQIAEAFACTVPGRWKSQLPFGMPTSINPYIVVLGVSPGAGEEKEQYPYGKPTIGFPPHFGFNISDDWKSPYWRKVRHLCTEIIQNTSPVFSTEDCLSISGSLNLGTAQQGTASQSVLERDTDIVKWVPYFITKCLKPKIVVCFGIKSLLKQHLLQELWRDTAFSPLLESKDMKTFPFECASKKKFCFQTWRINLESGDDLTIILWPNHPSRRPFAAKSICNNWRESVSQCKSLLPSLRN